MFQMTGQYPHVVERQAAGCQDPQPLQNVRADDPIRVRLDINQMADADQSRLARTYIECSFNVARMRERRPTNHACDPIIGVSIGKQCLIFRRVIRRFNCHGAVDPSRLELRRQVVWLKGTPKRLERGIACVRQYTFDRYRNSRSADVHRRRNSSNASDGVAYAPTESGTPLAACVCRKSDSYW